MKKILLALFLISSSANALPVINNNVSTSQSITVYPDHVNPDLFYVAPIVLRLNKDEAGIPIFSYFEYRKRGRKKAIIQASMSARFADSDIAKVRADILKTNPKATFSSIPFIKSKVVFGSILEDLIERSLCDHAGYISESEQVCSFVFNNRGRKIFRRQLRQNLLITLNYNFTISGMREIANGKYEEVMHNHSIAGRMGGRELADYPELFRDHRGRAIKF